jgi:hypothetical protein
VNMRWHGIAAPNGVAYMDGLCQQRSFEYLAYRKQR